MLFNFNKFLISEDVLLENRIEKIKDIFKDKLSTEHDTTAEHHDSDSIVDHFANKADPSNNKVHTQWILNQYKKKTIRQEDHPRIKETLSNFEKYKPKLQNKDLNQYKSIHDVEDAVEPHLGKVASNKEQKRNIKAEGAELIHSSHGVTIHHIKTKEAAMQYGAGTKWCTAGKNDNMFDKYNKQGPLLVIQHKNRKFQMHNHSKQFMDIKDKAVDLTKLHPDIHKALISSTHPEIKKSNITFHNPLVSSKDVEHAFEHGDHSLKADAAEHPNAPSHIIHAGLDHDGDWDEKAIAKAAMRNVNAQPEHIIRGLNHPDEGVNAIAAKHKNNNDHTINTILNHPNQRINALVTSIPNIDTKHVIKAMDHSDPNVRAAAYLHSSTKDPKLISKGLEESDSFVRSRVVRNPHLNSDHIHKALNDSDRIVKTTALEHANVKPEHITKALNDKDHFVRAAAISNKNATPEHLTKALSDPERNVRHAAIIHKNITKEHVAKALNDHYADIRKTAAQKAKKMGL